LILLLRKKSFVEMPSESNKLLMDSCIETLVQSSRDLENGADSRPFVILSELCLILFNEQKVKYTKTTAEDVKLLKNIEALIKTTTNCYTEMHKRAKDSVLAVAIRTLDLESDEVQKNPAIALSYVRYTIEILCHEFFAIENLKDPTDSKSFTVILAITLLKKLLLLNANEEISSSWSHWFNHHKIFNRLISVTSLICQDFKRREITAEFLDLLVLFAKGSHSKELIYCDIGDYLWMKLLPPKDLVEQGCDVSSSFVRVFPSFHLSLI
jgi:nuclear pore complex protein Nup188